MSTTIDQRVVEMRFDNRHFEQNVSTTMSTLDKLKQKLHLDGATKGLENVNSAARGVKMDGLGAAVDAVSVKFSALQVMGVTALANITNSAVNAGKRIVSALTIDPIKTGFQEYETQINATQTILSNTQHKGSTIDDVNKALEELNKYADMTIYNFTEMTRNIGTFTAAGIDLDTSVNAIQGIANLAAVSGSTSQQASTAMYQLSQALAAGTIRLMDWNSVVNAGMGGELFQNALKETSELLGTGAEAAIKATGSFRESLREEWLTAEVLTETLKKFTTTGANEYIAEYTGLTKEAVEAEVERAQSTGDSATAIDRAAEALAKMSGKSKETIKETLEFAQNATDAATKVKTFTQLWDVLKESAQSGWAQTWKILIGNFEQAKNILTPLSDFLTGVINKTSEWRNAILESALGRGLGAIGENLNTLIKPASKAIDTVKDAVTALENLDEIVNQVIRGEWGNGQERFDGLAKSGYNYCKVQNEVNKKLKNSYRYTEEQIAAQDKLIGKQQESAKTTKEKTEATVELTKEQKEQLKQFAAMDEAQAKSKGYTDEQIEAMKELAKTADDLGIPLNEFIDNIDQINGRWLLINSFKNIGQGIIKVFNAMKDAWQEIFPPKSIEERGEQLFNIIAAFHKFTSILEGNSETADKLRKTFKGVFAILDMVTTVIGGGFKIAFKVISSILSYFNLDILDVTASVGDAIVKFHDWFESIFDISWILDRVVPTIQKAVGSVKEWFSAFKKSESLQKTAEFIRKIGDTIKRFLNTRDFSSIPKDIIAGFSNGLRTGAIEVWNAAVEMVTGLVQRVKDFLGIHSPSTVFAAIGGFIIAGLILGLQNGIPDSLGAIKDVFQPMLDWIKNLDFGAVIASVIGIFGASTAYKAVGALGSFASMFEGLGDIFEGVGTILKKSARPIKKILNNTSKVVKGFANVLNGVAFNLKMEGVKTLVESILFLVGAIVVLTLIEPAKLWNAVGVIAALSVILGLLALAMNKLNSASVGFENGKLDVKGLSSGLLGIGIAILLIGITAKMLGSMSPDQIEQGFAGLLGIVISIGAVIAAFGFFVKGKSSDNVDKFGKTMVKLSIALLLMAIVVKTLGKMDEGVLKQGYAAIVAFGLIIVGLMAATKLISGSKNVDNIGGSLLKIALAIGVMALVANALGKMDRDTLIQGGIAIIAFGGIIVGLMAATKLISGSKNVDKIGGALFKIALAIGIMGLVAKLLGNMDRDEIIRGGIAIIAFGGIIVGLMAATKLISGSKNVDKIGTSLLAISGAIAIMALTAFMLSMVSWEGFAKGTLMITAFSGIIVGLMAATKLVGNDADKIGKTILSIAGAIGVLALIAVLLSLVPPENMKRGLIIVSVLSVIMAGLIAVTGLAKNCLGNIIALTAAIAVIAGAVYLLSTIPAESAITSALILGGLMVVMTGVLAVINIVGKTAKDALMGVLALTAMAIPLLAFVGVLALMRNITVAKDNVIALLALATVMTLLLIPLTIIGAAGLTGAPYMGALALLTMAVPLLAFVGVLALMQNVQGAMNNAIALSLFAVTMTGVLAVLTLLGPAAMLALPAMGALIALTGGLTLVLLALGGLSKIPGFNELIADGGATLALIGRAIGAFVGSIVAGFAAEILTLLPQFGMALSGFMVGVQPFIIGMKTVDDSVLTGAGILSAAIIALTAADLIAGFATLGGLGLVNLGAQLSGFMMAAMPFIMTAATITPEMLAGVKALSETILILTAADILQGLASFIGGGSSLESFATQLPLLGSGLSAFSSSLGTFSEEQLATVNCAAQAIKTLAQASSEIPNAGGLLGMLVGENDLGTFAAQFPVLGTGLRGFLDNVGEFTDAQVATVNCAAQAIKTLAQASSEIPNSGGWIAQIVGENDLGTFAEQFPALGTGLRGFLDNVGTLDDTANGTITAGANAVAALASAAANIPNEGGWISKLVGDNNLSTFASNFPELGTALRGFIDNIGTFTGVQVVTIHAVVAAINALTGLANADLSGASKHLVDFGNDLPDFATDISDFCTSMPSSDTMTSAVNNLDKLLSAVEDIGNANSGCLSTFADDLKTIGKNAVDKFVEAFTNSSVKTDLKEAAKTLGDKVVDGIENKERAIKTAGTDAAKKAVDGVETQEDDMETAGKDLGSGLVRGIKSKETAAYNAGYDLGQKAVQGEKDGQQSKSPSKLTMLAGQWIGEGLVIGMGKMSRQVYNAGVGLGKTATKTISSAVSRIADLVNTDIDSQPTIRPVLDLSDVRSGVSSIGSLFAGTNSVGVKANVSAISSMMNERNQNGVNTDVVSAINKLRKDLSNIGNTTYSINGVTYDDGSNIAEAVKTITRAAIRERRV